jgi:hypothetical protein
MPPYKTGTKNQQAFVTPFLKRRILRYYFFFAGAAFLAGAFLATGAASIALVATLKRRAVFFGPILVDTTETSAATAGNAIAITSGVKSNLAPA